MVLGGRLSSNIDGRWEVDSKKLWEVGYWPRKQVRVGRLAPKTGGRLEVETPVGRTTGAPLSPFIPLINTTLARARSLNAL